MSTMKYFALFLLFATSCFSQKITATIDNVECVIDKKTYSKAKLVYEFSAPIKVKNMNFKEIGKISGTKLTITGKDEKGDAVSQVWLGKPPKVEYKEPEEVKPMTAMDDTIVK